MPTNTIVRTIRSALLCVLLAFSLAPSNAFSALVIREDFDDGSVADGTPAQWRTFFGTSSDLAPGLQIVATDGNPAIVQSGHSSASGWSIRTRAMRVKGDYTAIGNRVLPGGESSWLVLNADGDLLLGAGDTILDTAAVGLDPDVQDVIFQLDSFNDQLQAWAWLPGSAPTTTPLLTAASPTIVDSNPIMWVQDFAMVDGGDAISNYSWIEFSDSHLELPVAAPAAPNNPEPSSVAIWCLGFAAMVLRTRSRKR